jgi:hypothetical protein
MSATLVVPWNWLNGFDKPVRRQTGSAIMPSWWEAGEEKYSEALLFLPCCNPQNNGHRAYLQVFSMYVWVLKGYNLFTGRIPYNHNTCIYFIRELEVFLLFFIFIFYPTYRTL